MFKCEVCGSISKPNQPLNRIYEYREIKVAYLDESTGYPKAAFKITREIAKEIPACSLCCEGHAKGIPLAQLAQMHRPKPKVVSPPVIGNPHPLPLQALPLILPGTMVTSPKEKAPIDPEAMLEKSSKKKPLKVKYENLKKKRQPTKGKQAGAKVSQHS